MAGCTSFTGVLVDTTQRVSEFIKDFRDARPVKMLIAGHLERLKQILEILERDTNGTNDERTRQQQPGYDERARPTR